MRPGPARRPNEVSKNHRKPSAQPAAIIPAQPTADFGSKRDKSILVDTINPIMHPEAFKARRVDPLKLWNPAFPEKGAPQDPVERALWEEDLRQRANPYRE